MFSVNISMKCTVCIFHPNFHLIQLNFVVFNTNNNNRAQLELEIEFKFSEKKNDRNVIRNYHLYELTE